MLIKLEAHTVLLTWERRFIEPLHIIAYVQFDISGIETKVIFGTKLNLEIFK
jgi:hypothetical protein